MFEISLPKIGDDRAKISAEKVFPGVSAAEKPTEQPARATKPHKRHNAREGRPLAGVPPAHPTKEGREGFGLGQATHEQPSVAQKPDTSTSFQTVQAVRPIVRKGMLRADAANDSAEVEPQLKTYCCHPLRGQE